MAGTGDCFRQKLKGEYERRGKTERMTRTGESSPKKTRDAITSNAMTTSVAKKVENASTASNNRAYSNGGSGEDRGGNGMLSTKDRGCSKKPLCDGSR